jgi:uncharacterized protein with ParB-like and HNH nuclease domain
MQILLAKPFTHSLKVKAMNKDQSMEEVSVKQLLDRYDLIVPEIQREYVWGNNEFQVLDTFITDIKEGYEKQIENGTEGNVELQVLLKLYEKADGTSKATIKKLIGEEQPNDINIGFLYSYRPAYYISNDRDEDVYLIDGQQRFTTLFLMLFYFAIKENKKNEFIELFRFDKRLEHIAFDYRVRTLTHNFLFDLIGNTETIDDILDIANKNWFLSNYKHDVTIQSIVGKTSSDGEDCGAFPIMHKRFANENNEYFAYIKNKIKFWHFKTEETSQGEELYITMNSRGQQLADNETIRAKLFESECIKNEQLKWSEKWEQWQDFFWKNRDLEDKDSTADRGFNEFLACISGLTQYLSGKTFFYPKDAFEKTNQIKISHIIDRITILDIENYITGLRYLVEKKNGLKSNYDYCAWVEKCLKEMWDLFNKEKTNWYADYGDDNRGIERNRMVFLWGILFYLKQVNKKSDEQLIEIFRVIRVYYLKYHNYIRSVKSIKHDMENRLNGNISVLNDQENSEESLKTGVLNQYEGDMQLRVEELLWELEDHEFNLNGRDVGGTNISHLIDFKKSISITYITKIINKFKEVFPENCKGFKTVQNILLYHGEYWKRVSPYYYKNLKFDDWRRTIRENVFKSFFKEFLLFDSTLEVFLGKRREVKIDKEDANDLRTRLLWYNQILGDEMWSQGNYIAIREWESQDAIFLDIDKLFNTKGNFKGGTPKELYKLLPEEIVSGIEDNVIEDL